LTLKYLGEHKEDLLPAITKAVTFSVPLHLSGCARKISTSEHFIYSWRFLSSLRVQIAQKARQMPDLLSVEHLDKIKTLSDFDNFYTAPIHGFKDAEDYYTQCSSIHFLQRIKIPTLIVNAQNDPFLSDKCFFDQESLPSDMIYFAAPSA